MSDPEERLGAHLAVALAFGSTCWATLRWGSVLAGLDRPLSSRPGVAVVAVALSLLTYASLASVGLVLARDGARRWWLPGVLGILALMDLAGNSSGVQSALATGMHPLLGALVDAALVLGPAALLARARGVRHEEIAGRLVPSVFAVAASFLLIMLVGQSGPDGSLPVAVLTLTFGIVSSRWSVRRAALFAWLGLFLGRLASGDITLGAADGSFPLLALVSEGWVDMVVALLAFAIAPASRALARRVSVSAAAS